MRVKTVICMTGFERTVQELLERLSLCSVCPMQEVRLDALKHPELPGGILPVKLRKLLVTFRGGSHEDRFRILEKALDRKPGWIDLEADFPRERAEPLIKKAREKGVKVLRSLHLDEGSIPGAFERLSRVPGDGIKLAARVEDVVQLEAFFEAPKDRPAVLLGTGPAGVLSRALYNRFNSAWTYVSAAAWPDPSLGMPNLEDATNWSMPVRSSTSLFVLLGDESITASPGAAVYNRLFRQKGTDAIYLPAVTRDVERAFSFLGRLGLKGASVTVPHKAKALSLAAELSGPAKAVGAVNTLYTTPEGEWRGDNTDVYGVRALVEKMAGEEMRNGVILGRGGFARACAHVLAGKGVAVEHFGREVSRTELNKRDFDILINATPDGSVPEEIDLGGRLVLDGVLSGAPTPLAKMARAQGAPYAGGAAIWGEQGARQLRLFGGPLVDPDSLAEMASDVGGLAPP